jgi:hypothetical protein
MRAAAFMKPPGMVVDGRRLLVGADRALLGCTGVWDISLGG